MRFTSLLHWLDWGFDGARTARSVRVVRKRRTERWRFVPRFDVLEGRALPSTFTVLNLADSGAGSLRQAILDAEANPGADVVAFAKGVKGTITLTSGELGITSDLTVSGPGANTLTISGNDSSRIFNVLGGTDTGAAIVVNLRVDHHPRPGRGWGRSP